MIDVGAVEVGGAVFLALVAFRAAERSWMAVADIAKGGNNGSSAVVVGDKMITGTPQQQLIQLLALVNTTLAGMQAPLTQMAKDLAMVKATVEAHSKAIEQVKGDTAELIERQGEA